MKKTNVLYICDHDGGTMGGASWSLYNMIMSLRERINPLVWFPCECKVMSFFQSNGIECICSPKYLWALTPDYKDSIYSKFRTIAFVLIQSYKQAKTMKEMLADRKIDIIHTNCVPFIVGYLLSRMIHAKHVWHVREYVNNDFGYRPMLGWYLQKKMLYKSDAVIAITKGVYEHFGLNNYKNATYVWDAIISEKKHPIISTKNKYFLFCANSIAEHKGAHDAIEAFAKSKLYEKGYRLKMVGKVKNEEYQEQLDDLSRSLNVLDFIDYYGLTMDVRPYFSNATAFLMCSRCEGLGRVTVEAMAYGCPVIGKNSGGTAEIVENGRNGFLYDTTDECAGLMKKVVEEDMTEMIGYAQNFAFENFSEGKYGKKILEIYNKILCEKNPDISAVKN